MVYLLPITDGRAGERQITFSGGAKKKKKKKKKNGKPRPPLYTLCKRINDLYGVFHILINPPA